MNELPVHKRIVDELRQALDSHIHQTRLVRRQAERRAKSGSRKCLGCGRQFKPAHSSHMYHSVQCRKAARYAASKAQGG